MELLIATLFTTYVGWGHVIDSATYRTHSPWTKVFFVFCGGTSRRNTCCFNRWHFTINSGETRCDGRKQNVMWRAKCALYVADETVLGKTLAQQKHRDENTTQILRMQRCCNSIEDGWDGLFLGTLVFLLHSSWNVENNACIWRDIANKGFHTIYFWGRFFVCVTER